MLDVQEAAVTAAREIEETLEEEGWDRMATMFLVRMGEEALEPAGLLAFANAPPHVAIRALARAEGELAGVLRRADGVALCVEGWRYPDQIERAMAQGAASPSVSPVNHPDRVESRFVLVMLRNGVSAWASRVRGEGVRVEAPGQGSSPLGSAVEAIEFLFAATGGRYGGALAREGGLA